MNMSRVYPLLIIMILGLCLFSGTNRLIQEPWTAPAWTDSLYNPYNLEPLTLPQAQEVYTLKCISCHGKQGQGYPMEHTAQEVPNFKQDWFRQQSDGALYWKIREGRGVMPGYKSKLSNEQLWQLVEYVRDLSRPFDQQKNPFKVLED
jgi:mono/diheme cytochrome c family protein